MTIRALCMVLVFAAANVRVYADDGGERQKARREDITAPFETIEDWDGTPLEYIELMAAKATNEDLDLLAAHDNPTVALAAAWERVLRTLPTGEEEEWVKVDDVPLSRFLGFVEGRLQMPLPDFWCEAVRRAEAKVDGQDVRFWRPRGWKPPSRQEPKDDEPHIRLEGDSVFIVTLGEEEWRLEVGGSMSFGVPVWQMYTPVVVLTGDTAYIIAYSFPLFGDIYAFDRRTGGLLWRSSVGFGLGRGGGTGGAFMEADLILCHGRAYVFGACGYGVFVNAFDQATGEAVLIFSTGPRWTREDTPDTKESD